MQVYLAIDLGAGSGRIVAGLYNGTSLELEEVHRFSNDGVEINGGFYWNTTQLYTSILEGLKMGVAKYGKDVVSVGADTWGCDYAMLDQQGNMLGGHRQYRDPRIDGIQEVMDQRMSPQENYQFTGIQPLFYNTSLHLLAEQVKQNPCFEIADQLLFTPDLLAYWLCGVKANEQTVASTSQLYNPATRDWAWELIDALKLPRRMFKNIVAPGTVLGPLTKEVAEKMGADHELKVVASAGHDTASAVAGLPMQRGGLWLSSGTWSILGIESETPVTNAEAFEAGLSNEGGVSDTTRLLHNVSGLWIIQESQRYWAEKGEDLSYGELALLAEEAPPFTAFIDPNDPTFATPGNMPEKIQAYCQKTGQQVPEDKGTILRVATESLAMKYREVIERLKKVTGRDFDQLNAGGGGIQNQLLIQATSNVLGLPVVAGPTEATSSGNIITQMVATGALADITEGRELIASSMDSKVYTPEATDLWQKQFEIFLNLTKQTHTL